MSGTRRFFTWFGLVVAVIYVYQQLFLPTGHWVAHHRALSGAIAIVVLFLSAVSTLVRRA